MTGAQRDFAGSPGFLTRRHVAKANALVPAGLKTGRVLDVGCRFFRYLALQTSFSEKYGLDKGLDRELRAELKKRHDVALIDVDLEYSARIPFGRDSFEVVIMLTVLSHVKPVLALRIIREIERILKPGGVLIMTTRAEWTKGLLKFLTRHNVVIGLELEKHKASYSRKQILAMLEQAGFAKSSIASGYFDFFMNIWVRARKEHNRFELEDLEPPGT